MTATTLLCFAGAGLIAEVLFSLIEPSSFIHAVLFQDLAGFGTFVAAGAAWFAALASRRSSRSSSQDDASAKVAQAANEGMTATEYQFMSDLMHHMTLRHLTPEQISQLQDMLRALRDQNGLHPPVQLTFHDHDNQIPEAVPPTIESAD